MAIYDKNSNELTACYDASGNVLQYAYDASGNVIFDSGSDTITLNDIVSYYRTPTANMVETINSLGDDIVSFVILTDTHSNMNQKHSPDIVRYLVKNSKADKCFWLGDVPYSSWNTEEFNDFYDKLQYCRKNLYMTLGNHDYSSDYTTQQAEIGTEIHGDKTGLTGDITKFYYYFDDTDRKIRYIVVNVSETYAFGMSNTQITWLNNAVQVPDSTWHVIALGHCDIDSNDELVSSYINSTVSANVGSALNSTNGILVGWFCGHEHYDRITTVTAYPSITQACLLNDSCARGILTEYNFARTSGTVTEQAVSIVSVDLTNRAVTIRRIGAGNTMTYNY